MQVAYQFKLYPSCVQENRLLEWQSKIRSMLNLCLADRIDTYIDCWLVSVLLRDKSIPDYKKAQTELKWKTG